MNDEQRKAYPLTAAGLDRLDWQSRSADPIDQPTPGARYDSTGAIVSKAEPAPYGHNRYRVWHHGRYIGTVSGGGDRHAAGRSAWWSGEARPAEGQTYGRSFRYCRNRREAIDDLIAESYRQDRKAAEAK